MTTASWSKDLTRTLVDVALQDSLESLRVSVRVEVHGRVHAPLWVKGVKIVLDHSSLTSSSGTNVEDGFVN